MATRHPFSFFFHGVCDPQSVDRGADCFVVFETAPAKTAQASLLKGCPKPLSGPALWEGRFLRVESDGDTFDAYMAKNEDSELTHKDTKRFADELDKWLRGMHAKAPISFVIGPWRPDGLTAWRDWSEGPDGIERAAQSLNGSKIDKKSKITKAIVSSVEDLSEGDEASWSRLRDVLAGKEIAAKAASTTPAKKKSDTPPKAAAKIAQLGRGGRLDLSELRLKKLPEEVRALKHISLLWLWENPLTELPEWIGEELTRLSELLVFQCALKSLPASLAKLPKLRELYVAGNKNLTDVKAIEGCKHLEELDLREVPVMPSKVSAPIVKLTFGGSNFKAFPKWVFDLGKSLEVLSVEEGSIERLPPEITKLKNLTELWISGDFKDLPADLVKLPKLRLINAADCKLTSVPAEFAKMKQLRKLDLSGNKVKGWKPVMANQAASKVLAAVLPAK